MKLTQDEMRLLVVLALSAPAGQPVPMSALAEFTDRPCKLRRAVQSLERWGLIAHDPFAGVARLLGAPVLRALACAGGSSAHQPVLFPTERPLDAARAEIERVPEHAACVPEHVPRVPKHKLRVPEHADVTLRLDVERVRLKRDVERNVPRSGVLPPAAADNRPETLQTRVAAFVGASDFARFWARAWFWADSGRCEILSGSLSYVQAGISDGVKTRTTPGRHLWAQFQRDCAARGLCARGEAAGT